MTMTSILTVIFLLLQFCCLLAASQQTTCSVCVVSESGKEQECQLNVADIIYSLSNITVNCTAVQIYMTSGTHIIPRNLSFLEVTSIESAGDGVIECSSQNSSAITFNVIQNTSRICISHLTFTKCQLIFNYASYLLDHLTIVDSPNYGVLSVNSLDQEIRDCTFNNNSQAHLLSKTDINDSVKKRNIQVSVMILRTKLYESVGYYLTRYNYVDDKYPAYIVSNNNATVYLINNTISNKRGSGIFISGTKYLEVRDCLFAGNKNNGLHVSMITGANINTTIVVNISNCLINDNGGTGLTVDRDSGYSSDRILVAQIFAVSFINNSKAMHLQFRAGNQPNHPRNRSTTVRNCTFHSNKPSINNEERSSLVIRNNLGRLKDNTVIIDNCTFVNNEGASAIFLKGMIETVLSNLDIHDNACTGIALDASDVNVKGYWNISRNSAVQGGAISLVSSYIVARSLHSKLILDESSIINMTGNTVVTYGGGVYTDQTCDRKPGDSKTCFFQFDESYRNLSHKLFFSGNRAGFGGDLVFGGCLSNCSVQVNNREIIINKTDQENAFQSVFSYDVQSQSTFVERPNRVAFCINTSSASAHSSASNIISNQSHSVSVFRGQTFNVSLISADNLGYPTRNASISEWERDVSVLLEAQLIGTEKYCRNFSYGIAGALGRNTTSLKFFFENPLERSGQLAVLTVNLENCPPGLKINSSSKQCTCNSRFGSYKIVCHSDTYSLEIPALTWVDVHKGELVAQSECQYCKSESSSESIEDITDKACAARRSGVMCGQCIEGYSLKLGGYECASCPKSPLVGIILVVTFAVVGVILVVLLLRLDLTISTGVINGLIFYTNIIYLNNDVFLPTSTIESSNTHLVTTVKVLSTLQAWMNLDFGINICFFRGYSTYIGTWMQFVFPLYIWLLISIIVLASRYSTTVAKVTTSNTVPVLATLLLMSYSKLLKTSIEIFSPVHLFSLDGEVVEAVWKQDGNIEYLGSLHLPLFLMSLLMVVAYILPFTSLVFLGPFIRSKSHYRLFRWYPSVKPFLDAFFGCYVNRYRYWPGILLLTRVVIIGIFASYSNNAPFKLVTISVVVLVLFILWLAIGKIETVSFYRKRKFNFLELFFLVNLGMTAAGTIYITQFTEEALGNQQLLAVVMVGSAMLVFFGIITYQVYLLVLKIRVVRDFVNSIYEKFNQLARIRRRRNVGGPRQGANFRETAEHADVAGATCTVIDLNDDELREPLLTQDFLDD